MIKEKMIKRKIISLVSVLLVFCVCMFGCKIESEPDTVDTIPTVLEEFNFGADGIIQILEIVPGHMAVVAELKDQSICADLEGKNPVDICKDFNGGVIPPAVQAAYNKVLEARKQKSFDVVENMESEPASADSKFSASEFKSRFCTSGWDYKHCWTDRTGDGVIQRTCETMYSYVDVISGGLLHTLWYYVAGSWRIVFYRYCPAGSTSYMGNWGPTVPRKSEAVYTNGAIYHYAVHGDL